MVGKILFAVFVGLAVGFGGHFIIYYLKHPKRIGRPRFKTLDQVLRYYGYRK